ncbi:hypothetical protein Ciccas_013688, partial [Cichlidogyrus casuarinus]
DVNDNVPEFVRPISKWPTTGALIVDPVKPSDQMRLAFNSQYQVPTATFPKSYWFNENESKSFLLEAIAIDLDEGDNKKLHYSIDESTQSNNFHMDAVSGALFLISPKSAFDEGQNMGLKKSRSIHHLNLKVCDSGQPVRCSQRLTVKIVLLLSDELPVVEKEAVNWATNHQTVKDINGGKLLLGRSSEEIDDAKAYISE